MSTGEPSTFGPYRLVELLGRGGMGEVWRAHDTATDRTVALKLLPQRFAADERYAARFRRECKVAAQLREAHVVPIHGFGEIDGRLYLDMRLVDGVDLGTWLAEHGPLAPEAAVAVVGQVAQALDAAHADGLIHRDVKPSNVLLADVTGPPLDPARLFAYLVDFGIARPREIPAGEVALTRAGSVPGSPAYVAPERLDGVEGEPAGDVYSLACVLFEALTGRPPFTGSVPGLLRAHLMDPPPRPSAVRAGLPPAVDEVVARGMAKDPGQRYASACALAGAARQALAPGFDDLRTIRSGSTMASAATVAKQPAEVSPDAVTVRFGGGVTAASPAPPETGGPARPLRRQRRRSVLGGALVTGGVVAAILAFLLLRPQTPLQVTGATVAPATDPGRACDVTVDVVGTVRTNGVAGTIVYEWTRSDGETSGRLTEPVEAGQPDAEVHLLWTLSGRGRYGATATLRIVEPTPLESAGSFVYDCR